MLKKGEMIQVRTFLTMIMTVELHLQSQIRIRSDTSTKDAQRWLMREFRQVLVIRMIRMMRMERIRTIQINGTSPNWGTFCFTTSAGATGNTIVDVTRVYKHVGEPARRRKQKAEESGPTAEFSCGV